MSKIIMVLTGTVLVASGVAFGYWVADNTVPGCDMFSGRCPAADIVGLVVATALVAFGALAFWAAFEKKVRRRSLR